MISKVNIDKLLCHQIHENLKVHLPLNIKKIERKLQTNLIHTHTKKSTYNDPNKDGCWKHDYGEKEKNVDNHLKQIKSFESHLNCRLQMLWIFTSQDFVVW